MSEKPDKKDKKEKKDKDKKEKKEKKSKRDKEPSDEGSAAEDESKDQVAVAEPEEDPNEGAPEGSYQELALVPTDPLSREENRAIVNFLNQNEPYTLIKLEETKNAMAKQTGMKELNKQLISLVVGTLHSQESLFKILSNLPTAQGIRDTFSDESMKFDEKDLEKIAQKAAEPEQKEEQVDMQRKAGLADDLLDGKLPPKDEEDDASDKQEI